MNETTVQSQPHEFNPNFIDSLNHPGAHQLKSLLQNTQDSDQIVIEDEENILQAMQAKLEITALYTTDKNNLSTEFRKKLPASVKVIEIAKRTCKKIFDQTRQSEAMRLSCVFYLCTH